MNILFIRHAKAVDRSLFTFSAKRDAARELTDEGRREMRKAAKGLRKLVPAIDVLATSPLVRAHQTAEIVADVCGVRDLTEQPLLAPDADPQALLAWLATQPPVSTIALVGHEPDLGNFASLLLAGAKSSFVIFKKGACALIECSDKPAAGGGRLAWLLQPGQLRKLD